KSVASAKPLIQALAEKRAAAAATASAAASTGAHATPQPAAPTTTSNARLEELGEQILQELQRRREHHDHDLSISKLLAGIMQIVSIAVLLLAYFVYRHEPQPVLLGAIFLQVFTVALLIMGRQR